MNSDGYEAFFS